jgi:hypothetical protein
MMHYQALGEHAAILGSQVLLRELMGPAQPFVAPAHFGEGAIPANKGSGTGGEKVCCLELAWNATFIRG